MPNLHSEDLKHLAKVIEQSKSGESAIVAEILKELAIQNFSELVNTLEFLTKPPELT